MEPIASEPIAEIMISFIKDTFPYVLDKPVDVRSRLFDEGIIDSFGILEVISYIEKRFEIRVHDEDVVEDNFATIENIAAYITRKKELATVTQNAS